MKKLIFLLLGVTLFLNGYAPNYDVGYKVYQHQVIEYKVRVSSLLYAFKIGESGGNYHIKGLSGEYGAYQYLPDTWKMWCRRTVGKILDITVPENQDLVTRIKIERLIAAGYNNEQIASIWNCGSSKYENRRGVNKYGVYYDVPAYVEKIIKLTKQYEKTVSC